MDSRQRRIDNIVGVRKRPVGYPSHLVERQEPANVGHLFYRQKPFETAIVIRSTYRLEQQHNGSQ